MREAQKLIDDALQARREGRRQDAKRDLTEAIALCRNSAARAELARALATLGQIERDLHNLDAARQNYEDAIAIYRTVGDASSLAHAVRHLGDVHRSAGHPSLAEPCYEEALTFYRDHHETTPLELANAIRGLAVLKADAGDRLKAISLWKEARALYAEAGVKEGVAESDARLTALNSGPSAAH